MRMLMGYENKYMQKYFLGNYLTQKMNQFTVFLLRLQNLSVIEWFQYIINKAPLISKKKIALYLCM